MMPGSAAIFAGSPVKRTGRDRFVRNVLIAIGNSGDASLADAARERLDDASPVVRSMAVWALARLLDRAQMERLGERFVAEETDAGVRAEWRAALAGMAASPTLDGPDAALYLLRDEKRETAGTRR